MPANNAELTVSFTSQSNSDHRVCWRVQGSLDPYDCTTIVSCPVGNSCDAIISLYINPEACEDVVLEGYVQPVCNDILSLTNRVPFTATFVANPTCISYEVTCNASDVNRIDVLNGGIGYTAGATLGLTIDGPATGTCDIGGGKIVSFNILNGGVNYAVSEAIVVVDSGSGAGAILEIGAVDGSGAITDITISNPGVDYEGPTVDSITTVSGSGAVIALISDYGTVVSTDLTFSGSGYSTVPNVVITAPGGGAGAQFLAVLNSCDDFQGTYCDGVFDNKIPSPALGESVRFCLQAPPTIAETMEFDQNGCCSEGCIEYLLENNSSTDGSVDFRYMDCGGVRKTETLAQGESATVCAVDGSVYVPNFGDILEPSNILITLQAACSND